MMWFRGCPRCQGDVYHDDEDERSCLQCGWTGYASLATDRFIEPERRIFHHRRRPGQLIGLFAQKAS